MKEYEFEDAYTEALNNKDTVIVSKVTNDKYRIEKNKGNIEIKFYSDTIRAWRKCGFILTEEITNKWIIENG